MKINELINKFDDLNNKNLTIDHICYELSKTNIDSSKDFENIAERLALNHTCIEEDGAYSCKTIRCDLAIDSGQLFEYYEKRRHEVSHPILIDMYCGMIYEFKKGRRSFELIKEYINNLCQIIDKGFYPYKSAEPKFVKRLIGLSIKTNNDELIEKAKSTTIKYINNSNNGVLLSLVLDKVFINSNKFEPEEMHLILEKTERLFDSLTKEDSLNYKPAFDITTKLCEYYNSINDKTKLKKSIDNFSVYCHTKLINVTSDDIYTVANLYFKHGFKEDFEREVFEMEKLQNIETQLCQWMDIDFPVITDKNYEEQETKTLEENLDYILTKLIPDINTIEEDLKASSIYSVLTLMIPKATQSPDSSGRTEGHIGGIDDDKSGNIVYFFDFQAHYNYVSLKQIINMFKRKSSKETLLKYFLNSYAFQGIFEQILEEIINTFLANNHFVFIHLIIPQIERAFRNIMAHNGHTTYAELEKGTETLELLDKILNEEFIKSFFGNNTQKFFRIILTDRRFLNIRNAVCHGYFPYELFNEQNSDLLMLIALCIAKHTKVSS